MKSVAVLLVFSLLLLAGGDATTQQTARVRGVIIDSLTGAVVPRATVVFESPTRTERVVAAKDGWYEAQLPVDNYRITVSRMTYCSVRRATAHIGALAETKFNFVLVPCPTEEVGILVDGRYAGEEAREVNPFNYDSFTLSFVTATANEVLVRFGTRQEGQRFIDYQGTRVKHFVRNRESKEIEDHYAYVGVMLSYNLLTVYADNLKLDKEKFEIEAQGNVIVEDGSSGTSGTTVRIRLRGDEPVIIVIRQ